MLKSQRGGFVLGLVLGLLLGLAVALGVALYITKTPVPFINKVPQRGAEQDAAETERNRNWDPNAPLAGKSPARPASGGLASGVVGGASAPGDAAASAPATAVASRAASAAAAASATAAASAARSTRDPAALLAGQAASVPNAASSGAAAPAARAASAAPPSFFVQAGAYARVEDGEAQRAKLALMGLAARITEREQGGRTVYRVRLGPFDSREEAEDAQSKLSAGDIESNLVRVEH